MPETDILNPTTTWASDIQDSMTPDYGFTRKRATTQLHKKAVGSTPWTRETQNVGHSFALTWNTRSWLCVQRLKWYFEQYEDGYFTIIDQDGGGRHFVGRFTGSEFPLVEVGNSMWTVQGLQFEEMPRVPMVVYPSDWNHDSILFQVNNNFGDQKLATSGAWTETAIAVPAVTLGGIVRGAGTLSNVAMANPGTAGDWATYEYRGYGFQLWLCTGPEFGKADIYLDEVLLSTVDCYAAADTGPTMVLSHPNCSLDIHRVMVMCDGTKNSSASATNITWWALQVMR